MQKAIRGVGVQLSERLRSRAERHVDFALDRFSDSIRAVDVQLAPATPKRDAEKSCQMTVYFSHGGQLLITDSAPDPVLSVSRAAERMARQVVRHLSRKRRIRLPSDRYHTV